MTARLGLGTVQFGLDYGIAHSAERTEPAEVTAILAEATRRGVMALDTAALYGDSEATLGLNDLSAFHVVTKTPRFGGQGMTAGRADEVTAAFHRSLERLHLPAVHGLLAHNAEDLLGPDGDLLYRAMRMLKDAGLVSSIGSSIYEAAEVDALLERFALDIVQVPVNILDQRLVRGKQLQRLRDRGVEVHARSAFLQGLLLMDPETVPAYFQPLRPLLKRWHAAAAQQGMHPVQAALGYVRHLPGVDVVVVGVRNRTQLTQCLDDFNANNDFDATGLASDDPAFVNPALWRLD